MLEDDLEDDSFNLASITENLSSSPSDTNKLVQHEMPDSPSRPVGMNNFRKKYSLTTNKNIITKPIDINHNRLVITKDSIPIAQSPARQNWKLAFRKLKKLKDPWAQFKLEEYEQETVIRHRYNPVKKEWIKDENVVKMQPKQFANGAMRSCFRL